MHKGSASIDRQQVLTSIAVLEVVPGLTLTAVDFALLQRLCNFSLCDKPVQGMFLESNVMKDCPVS